MRRVAAIISALVICIIVCLSWAVNHYRDNAITYKALRDKNARELKLANAAITDMQMRQRDVAALDAKYTKELADAKAENDALRDDVAAGRRRLHIKAVCQSVRETEQSIYECLLGFCFNHIFCTTTNFCCIDSFLLPNSRNEEMMGDGFLWCYCCRFVSNSKRLLSTSCNKHCQSGRKQHFFHLIILHC